MKKYILIVAMLASLTSCYKFAANKEIPSFTTIKELQAYATANCRFDDFKIGAYNVLDSAEKFGLDTLQSKFIWYANTVNELEDASNEKVIINTFYKEAFAVKYVYAQIHKEFPKLKNAFTASIASKKTEKSIISKFNNQNVAWQPLVTFEDELGYHKEIEIDKCNSNKALEILEDYPEVRITFLD